MGFEYLSCLVSCSVDTMNWHIGLRVGTCLLPDTTWIIQRGFILPGSLGRPESSHLSFSSNLALMKINRSLVKKGFLGDDVNPSGSDSVSTFLLKSA